MTLQQLIARYEAATSAQRLTVAATPLGTATATAYRLRDQLAALDDRQRAEVLSTLLSELRAIEPATVTG